ncbi:MAG: hypothetical protein E3J87_11325 [Candidatus Cloacimonadota bacterium]|nr:MAG: hypothetical protein E3J87_11325 [Candidatus Cloacimonadota bacterium]
MNGKEKILICKICDFLIGFEVKFINQVIQKKQVSINIKEGIVEVGGYIIPYLNIFKLFRCNENKSKFILLLNSEKENFAISISKIFGIFQVEPGKGTDVADRLNKFFLKNYAKRVILFNEFPAVVIDTNKLIYSKVGKSRIEETGKGW